ncbi:hypothetical protein [Phenylobacterium sp.]|uniref:hypothetical protein n=1 Tax=Phenylobacterium sp. TaxID=1871053 RepID=UPI0025E62F58|nr:hypothetical protein [Phenylobacterium sp.]
MAGEAAPDAKASDNIVTAQDRHTWRIMGGFITAVGVGVVAIAIATLREKWRPESGVDALYLQPYILLAPAAVAAIAIFQALNPVVDDPPPQPPRLPIPRNLRATERHALEAQRWTEEQQERQARQRREDEAHRKARMTYLPWAFGALVATAILLFLLAAAARRTPNYELFALTLPTAAPAVASAPPQIVRVDRTATSKEDYASGETRASTTEVTQQLSAHAPTRQAVMMWWVRKQPPALPSGLLPMTLGGIFLCLFGAYFPRINITAANSSVGFLEKAVAPALSLALVGVGATQQVQAARSKQDADLAAKGLPAVVSLSPRQLGLRETLTRESEARVLERESLSPEAITRLENSITELSKTLRDARGKASGEGNPQILIPQLKSIIIRNPGPPTPAPDENLAKIAKAAEALDVKASRELEAADQRRSLELARNCALLAIDDAQTAVRIRELRAIAAQKKAARARYDDRAFWEKVIYAKPEDGAAESRMAERLATGAATDRELRMRAVCPER